VKKKSTTPASADLRHKAEFKLQELKKKTKLPPASELETLRLFHELQVHQIELEMQNEELLRSRAEAEEAYRKYTDLYDFAPTGYFTLTREGIIHEVNLAGANLLGVERGNLINRHLGLFASVESRAAFQSFFEMLLSGTGRETFELAFLKKGSGSIWVRAEATCFEGGQESRVVMVEITESKHVEHVLLTSRNFLQSTLDSLSAHIAILDENGIILNVNSAWRQFGQENGLRLLKDGIGYNYLTICESAVGANAEESPITTRAIQQLLAQEISEAHIEYPCHSPKENRWFIAHLTRFGDSGKIRVVVAHENITERKQAEEELRHLSIHDPLTSLYNRGFFIEEMARLERGRDFPISIVMADVDHLKLTNDQYGHAAGDALLKSVAQVLITAFRAEDVVARIGGDEFAILLPATSASAAEISLQRVRQVIDKHNDSSTDMPIHISLGISTAEKTGHLAATLKAADENMYREKRKYNEDQEEPSSKNI